mgnify:CR=1 FL=1
MKLKYNNHIYNYWDSFEEKYEKLRKWAEKNYLHDKYAEKYNVLLSKTKVI